MFTNFWISGHSRFFCRFKSFQGDNENLDKDIFFDMGICLKIL